MSQPLKVPDVISRRQLLLNVATGLLFPGTVLASNGAGKKLSWAEFRRQMLQLAEVQANTAIDSQAVAAQGLQMLQQLDIHAAEFMLAVNESYESGNRYWLWQRMMKAKNINGGILNIDQNQIVQLHDHPGATGMVRIISGEAEVWQFDEIQKKTTGSGLDIAEPAVTELSLVSRGILRPGDTAVLKPGKGNIHALRSVSKECRMLDFFIPPYEISERSWFEPLAENWFTMERIACRKIPHAAYSKA